MKDLDSKDRKIISILQTDARTSLKELANKVGIARSTLSERIARLERGGVILGYEAKLGDIAKLVEAILLIVLDRTPRRDAVKEIVSTPGVKSCASLAGEIDLIAHIQSSSSEEMNTVRDTISQIDGVRKVTTYLLLKWE